MIWILRRLCRLSMTRRSVDLHFGSFDSHFDSFIVFKIRAIRTSCGFFIYFRLHRFKQMLESSNLIPLKLPCSATASSIFRATCIYAVVAWVIFCRFFHIDKTTRIPLFRAYQCACRYGVATAI